MKGLSLETQEELDTELAKGKVLFVYSGDKSSEFKKVAAANSSLASFFSSNNKELFGLSDTEGLAVFSKEKEKKV